MLLHPFIEYFGLRFNILLETPAPQDKKLTDLFWLSLMADWIKLTSLRGAVSKNNLIFLVDMSIKGWGDYLKYSEVSCLKKLVFLHMTKTYIFAHVSVNAWGDGCKTIDS